MHRTYGGVNCFNLTKFPVKAETAAGCKTQLSELPCGNAPQHNFSFVGPNINRGAAVKGKKRGCVASVFPLLAD